ncbi:MAG TPA: hypothetical protein VLX92_22250, partial [Kofleriaceae bacterium]|nr:hypothetical protein [Kofleriaceae bacterium]
PIDAPHGVYMSETSSNGMMAAMVYGQSIACGDNGDDNTTDNTWWRVYKPSDYGVNDTFHVTEVDVSVQETSTTPTITVNVGTYAGTIDAATINTAQITNLATAQAPAPPTSGQTGESLKFPITATIPAGAQFIVSVAAPNQDITGTTDQYFYIGATSAADTHRAYLSSTGCGITTPELVSTVSGTAGYMIIDVQGTN